MAYRTFYDMLEVGHNATPAEIKNAYRKLAMRWHPDRNKSPEAPERFREVSDAYQVLIDPERRAYYDTEAARIKETYRARCEAKQRARAAQAAAQRFADWDARFSLTPERLVAFFSEIEAWLVRVRNGHASHR